LVNGDGTTLQSWQYHKCAITDFVTYRNDNLLEIRFDFSLNSEIRDRTTFDCSGVYLDTQSTESFNPNTNFKVDFKVPEIIVSPHVQIKSGVSTTDVICKTHMELMVRPSSTISNCVNANSLEKLQEVGWGHISKKLDLSTNESSDSIIQGTLPDDYAISYRVNLVGSEVPDVIHSTKFSKFAPFTNDDIILPTAEIFGIPIPIDAAFTIDAVEAPTGATYTVDVALEDLPLPIPYATIPGDTSTLFGVFPHYEIGEKPEFYLESLPAKDKIEFYKWISQYVNPGKAPEPIDVGVEILDGDNNLLQTWIYRDCEARSYQVFLEDNILMIKYHEQWGTEIKDRVMFACSGLHIDEL
jgi:hypothetical protein